MKNDLICKKYALIILLAICASAFGQETGVQGKKGFPCDINGLTPQHYPQEKIFIYVSGGSVQPTRAEYSGQFSWNVGFEYQTESKTGLKLSWIENNGVEIPPNFLEFTMAQYVEQGRLLLYPKVGMKYNFTYAFPFVGVGFGYQLNANVLTSEKIHLIFEWENNYNREWNNKTNFYNALKVGFRFQI